MNLDQVRSLRARAEATMLSAVEAASSGDDSAALLANDAALSMCRALVGRSATPDPDDVILLITCLRNATTIRCRSSVKWHWNPRERPSRSVARTRVRSTWHLA